MPTIKQKVDMTSHELITYGIQNNIKNIILEAINEKCKEKAIIHFNENAMPIVSRDVNIHHVFEVEVEVPITEDTKMILVSRCIGKLGNVSYLYDRTTINSRLKNLPVDCEITHFYIENEDEDLVLIWKDGEMIEEVF